MSRGKILSIGGDQIQICVIIGIHPALPQGRGAECRGNNESIISATNRTMKLRKTLKTTLAFAGIALAATSAQSAVIGQLGILQDSANGGLNPNTGVAWAPGDTYRLVFVTSTTTTATSTDIGTYNAFVQGVANAAGLGSVTWNAVGSTATVDARDNVGANPGVDGTGEMTILMDGLTIIANDNADLWNGIVNTVVGTGDPATENGRSVYFNENGDQLLTDRVFTGTKTDGTANTEGSGRILGGSLTESGVVATGSTFSTFPAAFWPGERWLVDFSMPNTSELPMYGMSETLTVIPEPSSVALLGLGGLALLRRRRN